MAHINISAVGAAHPNRLSGRMNRKRKIFTPMNAFAMNKWHILIFPPSAPRAPYRLRRSMNREQKIFTPMKVFVINKQYGSAIKIEKFFYSCQTWVVIDTYYFGTSNQKHRTFFVFAIFHYHHPTLQKRAPRRSFFLRLRKIFLKNFS